jgi:hypothetical protein
VIYDNNHPALVPKAVSVLLTKTKGAVCYVLIPQRTRFLKDIASFEGICVGDMLVIVSII